MGYVVKGKECKGGCGRREVRTPSGQTTFPNGFCPKCERKQPKG